MARKSPESARMARQTFTPPVFRVEDIPDAVRYETRYDIAGRPYQMDRLAGTLGQIDINSINEQAATAKSKRGLGGVAKRLAVMDYAGNAAAPVYRYAASVLKRIAGIESIMAGIPATLLQVYEDTKPGNRKGPKST